MPHARRDRQYLIIILYITDHGLRNFGKGRYVPRSPLANRQIPAEPRFGSDLRPALKKPATTSKKGFQKKFPSIGDPGAEKVLLFTRSYPVMALDSKWLASVMSSRFRRRAEELFSDIPFGSGRDTQPTPPRLRFADRGTSVAPSARSRIVQAVEAALRRVPRLPYNRNAALSQ